MIMVGTWHIILNGLITVACLYVILKNTKNSIYTYILCILFISGSVIKIWFGQLLIGTILQFVGLIVSFIDYKDFNKRNKQN